MSAVASLVVMYYPKPAEEIIMPRVKMVEVDETAYGAVEDGEILFFNVQHPITKEYILPYPDEDPNAPRQSQYHPADLECLFTRPPYQEAAIREQVSRNSFHQQSRIHGDTNVFSPEVQRMGGDAFGSGWGAASDRFRRSAKLVPNLKECKDAAGLAMGESNGYPDEKSARYPKRLDGSDRMLARDRARDRADAVGERSWHSPWEGFNGYNVFGQRSQQTKNTDAGEPNWGNTGNTGPASDILDHRCAPNHGDTRPTSPRTVGMGTDNIAPRSALNELLTTVNNTAGRRWYDVGATTQFPDHDDPFLAHAPQPNGWFTPARDIPPAIADNTNTNNKQGSQGPQAPQGDQDDQSTQGAQQTSFVWSDPPRHHYGRPHDFSFQEFIAPGAIGPTHWIPLELRESESRYMRAQEAREAEKARQPMVRDSSPISKRQHAWFNPGRSTKGSPKRKQHRAQRNASSQWATKEVRNRAKKEDA